MNLPRSASLLVPANGDIFSSEVKVHILDSFKYL